MKEKIFTSILTFFTCTILFGQDLEKINYSGNINQDSKVKLSENWIASIKDNNVLIYNGSIQNETDRNVKNLELKLYLVPQIVVNNPNEMEGYLVSAVPIKNVSKNSSLVGVNIKNSLTQVPPTGIYEPILILSNKNNEILSFHIVKNKIESKENNLAIMMPPPVKPAPKVSEEILNPVVKMDIKEDNSLSLEKEWKVEVDFKNFMVKILGGDIANNTDEAINNMILDVYLTKENQSTITSNFEAVHIATAPLSKEIESYKKFVDTSITTNLTRIPQNGEYYILLTLSVKDNNGNAVVKTKRAFSELVSF